MANRSTKSGSEWTGNELLAYNIRILLMREEEFFGRKTDSSLENVSKTLLEYEFIPGKSFLGDIERIVPYLDMASRSIVGQESAVDDFARELLRSMGFESKGRIIRTRYCLRLTMSGIRTSAQTDISILSMNSGTLLLVQEDKRLENPKDPEPQVIAEAIAAFQENNRIRLEQGKNPSKTLLIPCITMVGTYPTFYLVPVMEDLNNCIIQGSYPSQETLVFKYIPPLPRRASEGMKPIENRKKILQCFEAFKRFVDEIEKELEE